VIQPFCSQQDKATQSFLLEADVTCQLSRFLAESLADEGANVCLILPEGSQAVYPDWTQNFEIMAFLVPTSNKDRRLEFNPTWMRSALQRSDLFITHNELVAFKARQVSEPGLKIVHFNHILPIGEWGWIEPLQLASWAAADLVVFMAPDLERFARGRFRDGIARCRKLNTTVWPMVFDERVILSRDATVMGGIDLLFVQRCSVSNYTHHREFIDALKILRSDYAWGGRVVFTDPTHYLELHESDEIGVGRFSELGIEFAHCETRQSYHALLRDTQVAVAMMTEDLHGGVAIREAIAAGCTPVLLDEPCYRTMLGPHAGEWPFFVPPNMEPRETADVLYQAATNDLHRESSVTYAFGGIRRRIEHESFQRAWAGRARHELIDLLRA
jgi:hypothetical protein